MFRRFYPTAPAVEISISPDKMDLLSAQLMSWGSTGVEEKESENGISRVIVYFPGNKYAWKSELQELVNHWGGQISISKLMEDDWANNWKQSFPSFEIIPGIKIVPSWEKPKINNKTIMLDPGMAFGTGTHQTTRISARAIYDLSLQNTYNSFLDVGCGSGILSIIAHHLNIKNIRCVDIDKEAIRVANENLKLNNVDGKVTSNIPHNKFDIIVANILLNPLIELKDILLNSMHENSHLILSGFTDDQEDIIKQEFKLNVENRHQDDEWIALTMSK